MGKVHTKNGFEYQCERTFYGHWVVYWYFRPIGETIFINYQSEKIKTVKKDIEKLLSSPVEAKDFYEDSLKRQSDIVAAEQNLKDAEKHFAKVYSPDFDLRGNNPNKEDRARKDAEHRLTSAKQRLEKAIEYTNILGGNATCV